MLLPVAGGVIGVPARVRVGTPSVEYSRRIPLPSNTSRQASGGAGRARLTESVRVGEGQRVISFVDAPAVVLD